jgi:AmmeMemoRadiSam system protein B
MQCRKPIVAGQFYPADYKDCLAEIKTNLTSLPVRQKLPEHIIAGIVPHAGWFFSGQVAAMVFSAIKQQNETVDTFIIFGAAHSFYGRMPAIYDKGCWKTPVGEILIDEALAEAILESKAAAADTDAHLAEHSIEVQVPFIQYLFPKSKIVPIVVPPARESLQLGEAVGDAISRQEAKKIVCIGSTDLTHYGPRYGFTPAGVGAKGIEWASNVNDRQFIDLAVALEPEKLLNNAAENSNACGPGAAAATIAAAKRLGCKKGTLLAQTSSSEVMLEKMDTSSAESVGYAAIVF